MANQDIIEIDCNYLNGSGDERLEENRNLITGIVELLEDDFSKTLRTTPVVVNLGDETFHIRLNDLLYSIMLMRSRFYGGVDYEFTKDDFVFNVDSPNKVMRKYFDETINFFSPLLPVREVNKAIETTIERIAHYAWHFNLVKGNSVNLFDLVKLASGNKEVLDILNYKSNENMQFSEIEASVEKQTKRLIEILRSDDTDTCLKNMLSSVSSKQFQQAFVNVSLKPDLYGRVIPKPINTSFLQGMRNSTDFFINSVGARKALVTNATQVRSAGYLSRKLTLLLIATELANDVEDCGTRRLLPVNITSEKMAERFVKRNYKLNIKSKKFTSTDTMESTKELIGKTIYLASPITCNLSDSNKVCKTCYGGLSQVNQFHIGLSSMFTLTEQLIQMLLSSKHLLQVSTDHIELPGFLAEYFEVDKNDVVAIKACKLHIAETVVDDYTNKVLVTKLNLLDAQKNIVDEIELDGIELSITDALASKIDYDEMLVDIKDGEDTFKLDIENNELSAPLKKLLKIIESNGELNSRGSISTLLEELLELLIESGIKISSTGMEMLIRELARNPEDLHRKSSDDDHVEFLRLTSAIIHSSSASVSLAFEQHNKLLEGLLFKKTQPSPLDYIF